MITPLLLALALVIAAAKLGGWISIRLGQPAVLGELVIGLLLGPSALNVFGNPYFEAAHSSEMLHTIGELGVIFLMFIAGLEIHLADMRKMGKPAILVGILGVVTPILLGVAVVIPFGYNLFQAIFVGIVLSATSVSISAQTLMELDKLRSREGLTLLGAAVVDDVLAIIALSVFMSFLPGGDNSWLNLVWIDVRILLFLIGASLFSLWILPLAAKWIDKSPISASVMSLVIVSVLGFAWAAEAIGGVAAITGAFIAGVGLSGSSFKHDIERSIYPFAYAFFVPIFLVSIGLTADIRSLSGRDFGLAAIICLIAILSKWLGAGLGAKLGGMTWSEAQRIGLGMISRGEVGLIIAGIGVNTSGLLNTSMFTIIVLMVLITTLVTPPLLRWAFRL